MQNLTHLTPVKKFLALSLTLLLVVAPAAHSQVPVEQSQDIVPKELSDIQTATLSELSVSKTRYVPATVVSDNSAQLKAEISAVIEKYYVAPGGNVSAGDVLLEFDCRDYELDHDLAKADLDAAKADLRFVELQYQRTRELRDKSLTSVQDLDSREAELASKRAIKARAAVRLKQAQRDVDRCVMKAPFGGTISEKSASEGELVSPGTAVLQLVDTVNVELSASVNPAFIPELLPEQDYLFQFGDGFKASLLRVAAAIDTRSRSVEARFAFSGNRPAPGASARLSWTTSRKFLPSRYFANYEGQRGLFVLEDSSQEKRLRFIPVNGAELGASTFVDLPPTTRIVVGRHASLIDGQLVR